MLLRYLRSQLSLKTLISSTSAIRISSYQRIVRKFSDVAVSNQPISPVQNELVTPVQNYLDVVPAENTFWYKILSTDRRYRNHLAYLDYAHEVDRSLDPNQLLQSDVSNAGAYLLLKYLRRVLQHCEQNPELIDSPKVTDIAIRLMNNLKDLNDEQLVNTLKVLTLWPDDDKDQRFFDFCKAVDVEAQERCIAWSYNTILLVMDHFYRLRVLRYSEYVWQNMKRLWRNPLKLTPQQIVHGMFLVNANRRWHYAVSIIDVEVALKHHIYEVSVEEAGILALAFFKTSTPARDLNLVNLMFDKLEQRIAVNPVDTFVLASYLKFFRLTTPYSLRHRLKKLGAVLVDQVDGVDLICCTHIALLGTRLHVLNTELLEKVCKRFCQDISSARIKDLERLALSLEILNFTSETEKTVCELIMKELHKRDSDIEQFPAIFLRTLNYLAFKGYFDYELIHKGLSIDFLKKAFRVPSPWSIPVDVFQLSVAVKLECPDYKGSCLGHSLVNQMSEMQSKKLPTLKMKLQNADQVLLSAMNVLEKILGGQKFVQMTFVTPHFSQPAVIFCLRDQQPVVIPDSCRMHHYMPIERPPDIGTWYAVNRLGVGNVLSDSVDPVGSFVAKIRHQKLLGYKPILVNEFEWKNLESDNTKYMKKLIEDAG